MSISNPDDNITWFTIYALCLPPFTILFLCSFTLFLKSLIFKSWRAPKTQIIFFTTLSCFAAIINNILRMISLAAFEERPWVLVLFIYIAQFMSGIFNFDAHMRLVMLWAHMYHGAFSKGSKESVERRLKVAQWGIACGVHCFACSILFVAVVWVIIFRAVWHNVKDIEERLMANPGVVYGALFVVYLLLSFGMTLSFLVYGGMLAYRIKTSPLSKTSDIKKLTILTSVAVGVHLLYIFFMVLGVIGLMSTVNDAVEKATRHVWPFFYLLGYAVIVLSTTILLCFFGRDEKAQKKKRKHSKAQALTEEEKLEKKMQDMELKEQRQRMQSDRIDSMVVDSPVDEDEDFEHVDLGRV